MRFGKIIVYLCLFLIGIIICKPLAIAEQAGSDAEASSSMETDDSWIEDDEFEDLIAQAPERTPDPLESVNRLFFAFNDKLYFWVLKPTARAYSYFVAEDVRVCIRNFFNNLLMPVRLGNNLLQGKVESGGIELARFAINSTLGVAGFGDPAWSEFNIKPRKEDFGQTLGFYGMRGVVYICWPLLGPSNLRDTAGLVGDSFLNPLYYLLQADSLSLAAMNGGERLNQVSLTLGSYEKIKEASFDPYAAIRDAYLQHRYREITKE